MFPAASSSLDNAISRWELLQKDHQNDLVTTNQYPTSSSSSELEFALPSSKQAELSFSLYFWKAQTLQVMADFDACLAYLQRCGDMVNIVPSEASKLFKVSMDAAACMVASTEKPPIQLALETIQVAIKSAQTFRNIASINDFKESASAGENLEDNAAVVCLADKMESAALLASARLMLQIGRHGDALRAAKTSCNLLQASNSSSSADDDEYLKHWSDCMSISCKVLVGRLTGPLPAGEENDECASEALEDLREISASLCMMGDANESNSSLSQSAHVGCILEVLSCFTCPAGVNSVFLREMLQLRHRTINFLMDKFKHDCASVGPLLAQGLKWSIEDLRTQFLTQDSSVSHTLAKKTETEDSAAANPSVSEKEQKIVIHHPLIAASTFRSTLQSLSAVDYLPESVMHQVFACVWNLGAELSETTPAASVDLFNQCLIILQLAKNFTQASEGREAMIPQRTATLRAKGLCLLKCGDAAGAYEAARDALELNGSELSSLLLAFESSVALELVDDAKKYLEIAVKHPNFSSGDAAGLLSKITSGSFNSGKSREEGARVEVTFLCFQAFIEANVPSVPSNTASISEQSGFQASVIKWVVALRSLFSIAVKMSSKASFYIKHLNTAATLIAHCDHIKIANSVDASNKTEDATSTLEEVLKWLIDLAWNVGLEAANEASDFRTAAQVLLMSVSLSQILARRQNDASNGVANSMSDRLKRLEDSKMAAVIATSSYLQHCKKFLAKQHENDESSLESKMVENIECVKGLISSSDLAIELIHEVASLKASSNNINNGNNFLGSNNKTQLNSHISMMTANEKALPLVRLIQFQARCYRLELIQKIGNFATSSSVSNGHGDSIMQSADSSALSSTMKAEWLATLGPDSPAALLEFATSLPHLSVRTFEVMAGVCLSYPFLHAVTSRGLLDHIMQLHLASKPLIKIGALSLVWRELLQLLSKGEAENIIEKYVLPISEVYKQQNGEDVKANHNSSSNDIVFEGDWTSDERTYFVSYCWNTGTHYFKLHNFHFAQKWFARAIKIVSCCPISVQNQYKDLMHSVYSKCISQLGQSNLIEQQQQQH